LEGDAQNVALVPSINSPNQVETSGFELAEKSAHMISWLGRGPDFRRFVTNDVESELYRQTPGAQLLSLRCYEEPELRTDARPDGSGHIAMVTDFSVTFPLTLRVRMADGPIWKLDIQHCYDATNVHLHDGRRQLRLNFTVVAAVQEPRYSAPDRPSP
jgi:hypothetical protein